jgi:FKBP-type peptidyl-prolyl cis-trans isomerase
MRFVVILFILVILQSAGCKQTTEYKPTVSNQELEDDLIAFNRQKVERENAAIDNYLNSLNLTMEKSNTGLRYLIDRKGSGDTIVFGVEVEVKYDIYLIDSTLCYSSKITGNKRFFVEESDEMPGMHELVKLLRVGDSARSILPSRLGYGFTGDSDKIPGDAVLLLDVEVLSAL